MERQLYKPWKNHQGKTQTWAMITFTGLSWFNTRTDALAVVSKALDWEQMTPEQRTAFCKDRFPAYGIWSLYTTLPWSELSPTSQLLLKKEGIVNQAVYENTCTWINLSKSDSPESYRNRL